MTAFQLPDSLSRDDSMSADYVSFGSQRHSAGSFVIVECASTQRSFLGQVISPQLNLNRDGFSPGDVSTLNALEGLGAGRYSRNVVVNEASLYNVLLLNEVTGNTAQSVRSRPLIGAVMRAATSEECVRYLNLPVADEAFRLGTLIDSDIPLCFSRYILAHHLLLAGSTGTGKSHDMSNLFHAILAMGNCVILFDHKPDYQDLDRPNESAVGYANGVRDAVFYAIGEGAGTRAGIRADEHTITVAASELDPELLARTLLYRKNEELQAELTQSLLEYFAADQIDKRVRSWSLQQFVAALPPGLATWGIQGDTKTYNALRGKIARSNRRPAWVDASTAIPRSSLSRAGGTAAPNAFTIANILRPGRLIVIRIPSRYGGGRHYALFLDYLMREIYRIREETPTESPRITLMIDEAQDIFGAGKDFANVAGAMLDEKIRKGRSLGISFILAVQSTDSVDEAILNNFNSQIIGRHNNFMQAQKAMPRAAREQLKMTESFRAGERLVNFFGANAVVHARMRLSPSQLTVSPE
jgi:hypothetical protein